MKIDSGRRFPRPVLALCLATAIAAAAAAVAPEARGGPTTRPAAGAEVLNFSLLDYDGKHYELRRTDARFVVLFFTGSDCPIARQTGPKLQALADAFGGKGVAVWLVNATPQNDPGDRKLDVMYALGRFAPRRALGDRYPVNGMRDLLPAAALGDPETIKRETLMYVFGPPPLPPVLRDERQLVSQYFGVTRTCEAVVIDTKASRVVYRGAVDDQFAEGARKPAAAQAYLRDALNDILAGRPVAVPTTKAHGCAITYDGPKAEQISYARDVAPVLLAKCVTCHSPGNIGPFAMSGYEKVKGWSAMIHEVLLDRRMPPWHADPHYGKFANDRSLTPAEAQTLTRWVAAGCPRGEGPDPLAAAAEARIAAGASDAAPVPPAWPLGAPDHLVRLPRQEVPATGIVDYRYVDSDFVAPRDMWLRAAITRPGNPKVVHHIIVRMRPPLGYRGTPSESYLLTTWVPGIDQGEFPPGTGQFVPRGARFNFEVHYTTDGRPHADESEVGLYEATAPAKALFDVRAADTRVLDIPPGQPNAQHTALYHFKRDAVVYGLSPHMHCRGSWFKFELVEPDGRRETLLSVPSYDFNWQTSYRLATPRRVPAGAWMLCTGGFDNSPRNPHNPDPAKRVTWGPQTFNEMFMGFIQLADVPAAEPPADAKPPAAQGAPPAKLPWLRPSKDNTHFVRDGTADRVVMWGFNYDRDDAGRLLEDYWADEWDTVAQDFREMRALRANVVRVHLQLGRFMTAADRPDPANLERLGRLVRLAEETGLYLDVTGLGCYHKQDVPAWYAALDEPARWEVQARFWKAVAGVCKSSPAVFCYDLMNEPILAGGDDKGDWLPGKPLAGKHFVQRITLDPRGRTDKEIAKAWVATLAAAIRSVDDRHMITVGVIPWAQVFKGAKPLFYAPEVCGPLDFVSVHFYPKAVDLDESLAALRVYEVGKPLVIEETFPLEAGIDKTEQFIERSRGFVDGYVSFYWGKTIDQNQRKGDVGGALVARWLERFSALSPYAPSNRAP